MSGYSALAILGCVEEHLEPLDLCRALLVLHFGGKLPC